MEGRRNRTPSFSNLDFSGITQPSELNQTDLTDRQTTPRHTKTNSTNLVRYQLFQLGLDGKSESQPQSRRVPDPNLQWWQRNFGAAPSDSDFSSPSKIPCRRGRGPKLGSM